MKKPHQDQVIGHDDGWDEKIEVVLLLCNRDKNVSCNISYVSELISLMTESVMFH